jgi:hypothetical protein
VVLFSYGSSSKALAEELVEVEWKCLQKLAGLTEVKKTAV